MLTAAIIRELIYAGLEGDSLIAACERIEVAWDIRTTPPAIIEPERDVRSIPPSLRIEVYERDGYACVYCGADEVSLHCDHVMPWSRGGRTTLENLATACKPCNSSKRARTPAEWRGRIC